MKVWENGDVIPDHLRSTRVYRYRTGAKLEREKMWKTLPGNEDYRLWDALKGAHILELGCGSKGLLSIYKEAGVERVTMVDQSKEALLRIKEPKDPIVVDKIHSGITEFCRSFAGDWAEGRKFDVVVGVCILEYLAWDEVKAFFRWVHKAAGKLVLFISSTRKETSLR